MKPILRQLGRSTSVIVAVVLSVGLALGGNAAILTALDAVLVRPLPYTDAARLVELDGVFTRLPLRVTDSGVELSAPLSAPEVIKVHSFSAGGAYFLTSLNFGNERPERLRAAAVTAGFFDALEVRPVLGHLFTAEEARARDRLAIIGSRLWRSRFRSDPHVVGASIDVNGRPFIITAVLPERVDYPDGSDLWLPYTADSQAAVQVTVPRFVARLASGATLSSARADVLGVIRDGPLTRQNAKSPTLRVRGLREALVGDVRPILLLVAAAAFLVLLVACLNSAHLLLARMSDREQEFAVRRALGASTTRLLRQIVAENAVLTAVATAISVPVFFWALSIIRRFVPTTMYGATSIGLDLRAFAILALLATLAAAAFGLPPAVAAGGRIPTTLRATAFATAGIGWRRFRSALVIVQIATALAILVAASAIVRTVRELASIDLGAHNGSALVMEVLLPKTGYDSSDRILGFHRSVRDELLRVPGIEEAGATNHIPGSATVITPSVAVTIEGQLQPIANGGINALRLSATPGYFSAVGIDVLAGRTFTDMDVRGAAPVAVVSESYARAAGVRVGNILGRRVKVGLSEDRWAEVVGVVRDVRMRGPESDWQPAMYLPFAQIRANATTFLVAKVRPGYPAPIDMIRSAIARIDPTVPLYNVRTLAEVRDAYLNTRRFAMASITSFGSVAFALAILGLYAVVHYMVRLRSREIGIRIAIGASPSRVRREVIVTGLGHTFAGVILGFLCSLVTLRFAAANVPGLREVDVRAVAALCALMFLVSIGAAWFPARRAARIDPLVALRSE